MAEVGARVLQLKSPMITTCFFSFVAASITSLKLSMKTAGEFGGR